MKQEKLMQILSEELLPEDLRLLDSALSGVEDYFSDMKEPQAFASPAALQTAAQRAREHRIRDDEAARQGRC